MATPSAALHPGQTPPGIAPASYNQLCPHLGGSPSCRVMTPPPQRRDSCRQIGATGIPAAEPAARAPRGMRAWGCPSARGGTGTWGGHTAPQPRGDVTPRSHTPNPSRADPHPHTVHSAKRSFAPKELGETRHARAHPLPSSTPRAPSSSPDPPHPVNLAPAVPGTAPAPVNSLCRQTGSGRSPSLAGDGVGAGREGAAAWEAARPAPRACQRRASVSPLTQPACREPAARGKVPHQRRGEGNPPRAPRHSGAPTALHPWGARDGEQRAPELSHPPPDAGGNADKAAPSSRHSRSLRAGGTGTNGCVAPPRAAGVGSGPGGQTRRVQTGLEPCGSRPGARWGFGSQGWGQDVTAASTESP